MTTTALAPRAATATHAATPCDSCSNRRPVFELTLAGTTFRLCQSCVLPEDARAAGPLSERVDQPLDFGPEWICATAISAAAAAFEVPAERLLAAGRIRKVADARIVAMAAAQAAGATPRAISTAFGRDHSTVSHALKRARSDPRLGEATAAIVAAAFSDRFTTPLTHGERSR